MHSHIREVIYVLEEQDRSQNGALGNTYGFMWFQVGGKILDYGGRYSDVWLRGVMTGPSVKKAAKCFFHEN